MKLAQADGGKYLNAQVFTGFMYVGAALCMWLLRAWKIGQLELLVTETEKPSESIDPVRDQPSEGTIQGASEVGSPTSNVLKRMCLWRRV